MRAASGDNPPAAGTMPPPPPLPTRRREFAPMFRLALPVVLAELGWMTMGLVHTLMVGRISPEAIGAVGIGSALFMGVCIFAMGLLLGLDTLVSHAFGAGSVDEGHRWLAHGGGGGVGLRGPLTA